MEVEFSNAEIQQMIYKQKPSLTEEQKTSLLTSVGEWFSTAPKENYYMLLCRDKNDYTLFHFNDMNYSQGVQEVKETLESRGEIIDIFYETAVNAYACWVRNEDGMGSYAVDMYLLFGYSWGVVEID